MIYVISTIKLSIFVITKDKLMNTDKKAVNKYTILNVNRYGKST